MESSWLFTLFLIFLVSVFWGVTNPFLKRASVGIEDIKKKNYILQLGSEICFLATKLSYVGPFLLNQMGSVLFVYALGHSDLSLIVPLTNSITFLVTTLTGHFLGEEKLSPSMCVGAAFVCAGISLCVIDKTF